MTDATGWRIGGGHEVADIIPYKGYTYRSYYVEKGVLRSQSIRISGIPVHSRAARLSSAWQARSGLHSLEELGALCTGGKRSCDCQRGGGHLTCG